MADDIRSPIDTTKRNTRSADWYEPPVQQGWTNQKGVPCPPLVTSERMYGHGGTDPYTATYYDDPDDPDTTPPVVEIDIEGDEDGQGHYVASVTVTVTATDPISGVDTVEYKLDDGAWTAYENPVMVSEVGQHTFQARATDNAENTSDPVAEEFEIVSGD